MKTVVLQAFPARMVELVDTRVSKTRVARRAGSTPAPGTETTLQAWFFVKQSQPYKPISGKGCITSSYS